MARLILQEAFNITGRGTVVTAKVVHGSPAGDKRCLIGDREFRLVGVEGWGGRMRPAFGEGANVGLVLGGPQQDLDSFKTGEEITTA